MSLEQIEKLIKDNQVEFIDLRFTDMRGIEQHVTFPASVIEPSLFEEGKMFDGSSMAGWRGIAESDMVLLPDAETAYLDPFYADPTLVLTCDVLDPATMQGYARCPRGIAKRAEAYLKASGIADQAFFRPGTGVLHFRFGPLRQRDGQHLLQDRIGRSGVEHRQEL